MARLNDPPVTADSLETLRRKFLRQNRDIARTNSTQSLKIRSLENECARLLSENLQLRTEILRLKTELQGSHANRIADHALQIKEKMEAQLIEWGSMLASLGSEPVPKSRSPRALKKPRVQRSSIGSARASDWRRRETMSSMEDLEAAALQEGRLPPLWEGKPYPRETLNGDEILALCSEADENAESPDLGPPPVSRFVDEDPVRFNLSALTRNTEPAIPEPDDNGPEDSFHNSPSYHNQPSPSREMGGDKDTFKEHHVECAQDTLAPEPQPTSPTAKAGVKRKIREGEEKDDIHVSKSPVSMGGITKDRFENATSEKPKTTGRLIKELPASKREAREKTQRKPLGAKSSNEALAPLKKSVKAADDCKAEKQKARGKDVESTRNQKAPASVQVRPSSSPERVVCVDVELETISSEPNPPVPHSPERPPPREETADTPPPVDISARGETARANRRARAAISYAEPNLRDKMRRPNTKQLFDAVPVEGKQIRRTSQYQRDESPSGASFSVKSESQLSSSQLKTPSDGSHDEDNMESPFIQKTPHDSALETLPASVTTDRKRKDSTAAASSELGADVTATTKSSTRGTNSRLEEIAAREAEVAKMFDDTDVYEFTNSPVKDDSSSRDSSFEEDSSKKSTTGRPSRSRRLSSMSNEDLQFNQSEKTAGRPTGARKRASMASAKAAKASLEDSRGENPPAEAGTSSGPDREGRTRERAVGQRRRNTMV